MKICFAGDVFLGGDLLINSPDELVNVRCFNEADVRVANIEQAVSGNGFVENKGTLFTGPEALENALKIRVDVAGLANNHIHDKGLDGVIETCGHLERAGIRHFGAGADISAAREPVLIAENLVLLGYCDFDRPYLRQIAVADNARPGINPLRYENIREDLDRLPLDMRAVLFFHWGKEHVWLPPMHDIELADRLLADSRVALIVGMHPHRPQGFIERDGKRAYFCIGNFLFPNFFLGPPTQLLDVEKKPEAFDVTRQYHNVYRTTYKKWRFVNRVSLVVVYDSISGQVEHHFAHQLDDEPVVVDLSGIGRIAFSCWVAIISHIYRAPRALYQPIERLVNGMALFTWRTRIRLFKLWQLSAVSGVKASVRSIVFRALKVLRK